MGREEGDGGCSDDMGRRAMRWGGERDKIDIILRMKMVISL